MNIARINSINFYGKISFNYREYKVDENGNESYGPIQTAVIDTDKVKMSSLYKIGKTEKSCRIIDLDDDGFHYIPDYKYATRHPYHSHPRCFSEYMDWFQKAVETDDTIEDPNVYEVFIKRKIHSTNK